jgi:NADH dehydrogenase
VRLPSKKQISLIINNLIDDALEYRVGAITPEHVIYTRKNAAGETEQHAIPSNFVLWSTGIAMNPFAHRVTSLLPNQVCVW